MKNKRPYDIHSEVLEDDLDWLEQDSERVRQWRAKQQHITDQCLSGFSGAEFLYQRFKQLSQIEQVRPPIAKNGQYFWLSRSTGQEHWMIQSGIRHEIPVKLVWNPNNKPNQIKNAGKIMDIFPCDNGAFIAVTLSINENSYQSIHVLDVINGKWLQDKVPSDFYPMAKVWPGQNPLIWVKDHSGFYYTRKATSTNGPQHLYFHQLGQAFQSDPCFFKQNGSQTGMLYPRLCSSGRYLAVLVHEQSGEQDCSNIYINDLSNKGGFKPLLQNLSAIIDVAFQAEHMLLLSKHNAPCGKVTKISLRNLGNLGSCSIHVKEDKHPIRSFLVTEKFLLLERIEKCASVLQQYDIHGKYLRDITLPQIGSIDALRPGARENCIIYRFSSFIIPPTIYSLNLQTGQSTIWQKTPSFQYPDDYQITHKYYLATDNQKVPITLVSRKNRLCKNSVDKNQATLVKVYGGFGLSLLPRFDVDVLPFLEQGGLYVIAHIRGGGELGENWHQLGLRAKRSQIFDDLNQAGAWLIKQGYTTPKRLGCIGWSNGGLTVNGAAILKPELWKLVVAGSPVSDLFRFHLNNHGKQWQSEYGDPENTEHRKFLQVLSPCHSMPVQIKAPSIMIYAPNNDDRVAPWHAYKLISRWQAANCGDNPVVLQTENNAGHRGSELTTAAIKRRLAIWSFIFWQLGLTSEESKNNSPSRV